MKHVGKMKNNGAPVAIIFRTLPGDPHSCLVVGTQGLGPTNHDALMQVIESNEAQQSFELGSTLAVRRFPDNADMLGWLHTNGKLKKIPTTEVLVTATPADSIPLNELNLLIAEQKGIKLEELAVGSVISKTPADKSTSEIQEIASVTEMPQVKNEPQILGDSDLARSLRSQADSMFKEAQKLRKQADELDPPANKKVKKVDETTA
jgi:hypothetical protein